jgi:hypothetical protein
LSKKITKAKQGLGHGSSGRAMYCQQNKTKQNKNNKKNFQERKIDVP